MAKTYHVRLKSVPPVASDPKTGRRIRLTLDGEECTPVQRMGLQVLVSLASDGFLTTILHEELVEGEPTE